MFKLSKSPTLSSPAAYAAGSGSGARSFGDPIIATAILDRQCHNLRFGTSREMLGVRLTNLAMACLRPWALKVSSIMRPHGVGWYLEWSVEKSR